MKLIFGDGTGQGKTSFELVKLVQVTADQTRHSWERLAYFYYSFFSLQINQICKENRRGYEELFC